MHEYFRTLSAMLVAVSAMSAAMSYERRENQRVRVVVDYAVGARLRAPVDTDSSALAASTSEQARALACARER